MDDKFTLSAPFFASREIAYLTGTDCGRKGWVKQNSNARNPRGRPVFQFQFTPNSVLFYVPITSQSGAIRSESRVSNPRPVSGMARATTASVPPPPAVESPRNPVCLAADQRPALDRTPVAGLPVRIFAFQNEAGFNGEVERGLILKADVNRMVPAGGKDLDQVHGLSFDLFKAIESAPAVAADRGLAPLGLGKAQRLRDRLSLLWFF